MTTLHRQSSVWALVLKKRNPDKLPEQVRKLLLELARGRATAPGASAGRVRGADRGRAYLSYAYQELRDHHGIRMSTSRPGTCLDNAVAGSFFKTLKMEMYYHRSFVTQEDARRALFEYIEGFYNSTRMHSTLDYKSPAQHETHAA